jgi:uncharacterized protein (TIGR02453 family)
MAASARSARSAAGETPDAPAVFAGFPDEALLFYEGLEADNSRAYWSDHAETYDSAVRAPMLALIAAVEPEFGPMKFFRPQRDLRFSADKSPYKTHAGAVSRDSDAGSRYVQVSAAGLLVAGGYYRMAKDQIDRYRAAVDDDRAGRELAALVASLEADGFVMHGEELRRVPRGFDPGHPRAGLLRRKGLAAFRDHGTPDWLGTPECLDAVTATWRRITPLGDWLGRHVGPPEPVAEGDRPARVRR